MGIDWRHATPDDSHPVEPRYESTGRWTCHKCREPVKDGARAIDMGTRNLPMTGVLTADPNQPSLKTEGS